MRRSNQRVQTRLLIKSRVWNCLERMTIRFSSETASTRDYWKLFGRVQTRLRGKRVEIQSDENFWKYLDANRRKVTFVLMDLAHKIDTVFLEKIFRWGRLNTTDNYDFSVLTNHVNSKDNSLRDDLEAQQ